VRGGGYTLCVCPETKPYDSLNVFALTSFRVADSERGKCVLCFFLFPTTLEPTQIASALGKAVKPEVVQM